MSSIGVARLEYQSSRLEDEIFSWHRRSGFYRVGDEDRLFTGRIDRSDAGHDRLDPCLVALFELGILDFKLKTVGT